jgi:hypothetical protein
VLNPSPIEARSGTIETEPTNFPTTSIPHAAGFPTTISISPPRRSRSASAESPAELLVASAAELLAESAAVPVYPSP